MAPYNVIGPRIFVCDPRCVEASGGDVPWLKYLSDWLRRYFSEVIPLCSKFLPEAIAQEYKFTPFFDFYYDEFVRINRPSGAISRLSRRQAPNYVDVIESVATEDATQLIAKYEIGADDAILLPASDFYAVIGFLNALMQLSIERRPRVFFRFMGISEYATNSYREPLTELSRRLERAVQAGLRVACGAETPRYADYLAECFGTTVSVVPYVTIKAAEAIPGGPFICFCGGGARRDKGFFQLWDLFVAIRKRDPQSTIRFVAQTLPDTDAEAGSQHYVSQLYAIPGVELLPFWISEDEIWEQYRRCSLVLLPYDRQTYMYRGSAVLHSAATYGRLAITLPGTAFAPIVEYYGLGRVVNDIPAMAHAVLDMASQLRERLQLQGLQARHRFIGDCISAFESWLRGTQ